jgi:hypothetical protein
VLSSEKLNALKTAIAPAIITEMTMAGPARLAAMPVTTKIPSPMIVPMPIDVALSRPMLLFNAIL